MSGHERTEVLQESVLDSGEIQRYLSREILERYKADLDEWVKRYDMSRYIGPIDHFAIKVEDKLSFGKVVDAVKPFCVNRHRGTPGLSIRDMHGRRIAVALLKEPIEFGDALISCIEIMQPRPEAEGKDVIGLDHLELINPNLLEIEQALRVSGADYYVDETNPYKEIIVSFLNDRRERIKFTNRTLAEIVPVQISDEPHRVEIVRG